MTRSRKPKPLSRRAALALLAASAASPVLARQAPSKEPQDFLKSPPKPSTLKGPFSLVAIGDLLNSKPMATLDDPAFQKVVDLVKAGDVAIGNREGVILDLPTFKGQPYGNGQMFGEAAMAGDMKAIGVDMMSMANNHSTDWGWEGLIEAQRLIDEAGLVHAGGGMTLAQARQAGIMTTPKGKVALVSTASTFKVNAGANDAFDEGVPARPGISTLRLRKVNLVNAEQMALVRSLASERASPLEPAPKADARDVTFGDQIYRLAPGSGPRIAYEMELYDQAALLKAVRDAKDAADLVVFTIHAHESPTGLDDDTPAPPDFLLTLFHQTVDAGADLVLGGGPHSLRGIEIYKGKPILYGMGLFTLRAQIKASQETVFRVWPDETGHAPKPGAGGANSGGGTPPKWLQGVVAVVDYDARGREKAVRLYPIDLQHTAEGGARGVPHLAKGAVAAQILADLQTDSAAFGTRIEIQGETGLIHIR
ncbi:CapA family protein [Caulobacter soli]|uniref:CapA family protein n=1 Tax=Caulobacter soli TaxID=2708539 RepID=UPI0013EC4D60|nr:CapA family protein [Caulobacter soli]